MGRALDEIADEIKEVVAAYEHWTNAADGYHHQWTEAKAVRDTLSDRLDVLKMELLTEVNL